jgi:hypothetical protein
MNSYANAFEKARQFSEQFGVDPERRSTREVDDGMWPALVARAKQLPPELFEEMKKQTDPFWAFGTSCADVHWYVVQRLRRNFNESFELTIGGVLTVSGEGFPTQ